MTNPQSIYSINSKLVTGKIMETEGNTEDQSKHVNDIIALLDVFITGKEKAFKEQQQKEMVITVLNLVEQSSKGQLGSLEKMLIQHNITRENVADFVKLILVLLSIPIENHEEEFEILLDQHVGRVIKKLFRATTTDILGHKNTFPL